MISPVLIAGTSAPLAMKIFALWGYLSSGRHLPIYYVALHHTSLRWRATYRLSENGRRFTYVQIIPSNHIFRLDIGHAISISIKFLLLLINLPKIAYKKTVQHQDKRCLVIYIKFGPIPAGRGCKETGFEILADVRGFTFARGFSGLPTRLK